MSSKFILRFGIPFLFSLILGATLLTQIRPPKYKTLEIEEKTYQLEIANTPSKREKGLMEREKLAGNEGMLFIFPNEARHSFWMYKTLIPLKIIWLNKNWEIVHIEENVLPCEEENPLKCPTYTPSKPAKYVVEINP